MIRFPVVWSTLTTWADCGLIWIPNKRRPWDSPWQGCQGGPWPLHILGNQDVLSPNTTDTSERLIHQMKIHPDTPETPYTARSTVVGTPGLWMADTRGLALLLGPTWNMETALHHQSSYSWELITRQCKSSKGGSDTLDSWETDDRRERSARKIHF